MLTTTALALLALTGTTQLLAARREARAARLTPPGGQDVDIGDALGLGGSLRINVEIMGKTAGGNTGEGTGQDAGPHTGPDTGRNNGRNNGPGTGPETGPDTGGKTGRAVSEDIGEAPRDLVLIHGASGNLRDFTLALAPMLAARYRVFLVDRPGLGWSDPLPGGGTLTDQARAIEAAVSALGATRPLVLGHSYGGAVALAWAATLPDRLSGVLPLSSVAYPWHTGLGAFYSILSHPLGLALVIPLLTAFTPGPVIRAEIAKVFRPQSAPPGFADHLGTDLTLRRGQMRANARQRRDLHDALEQLSTRWPEIRVPIEIVHGTADDIVPIGIHAEPLAAAHSGARLTRLDDIGHAPHHAAIPEVIAAIDRLAIRANVN